jgi:hypothetical protein
VTRTDGVAVLFINKDHSPYPHIEGLDVYDINRDARTWPGGCPVVAHPPCRAWGAYSYSAKNAKWRPDEPGLAVWAVDQVRRWGGVLEHPRGSRLWKNLGLPGPLDGIDKYGGLTLQVNQSWWGHRASKSTWLYICGLASCLPNLPPRPYPEPTHLIQCANRRKDGTRVKKGDPDWMPSLPKKERELTPPLFAEWLVELAKRCKPNPEYQP